MKRIQQAMLTLAWIAFVVAAPRFAYSLVSRDCSEEKMKGEKGCATN